MYNTDCVLHAEKVFSSCRADGINMNNDVLDLSTVSYDQAKIFFRRSTNNELRRYVESMLAGCLPYNPAQIALLRELSHRGDGEQMTYAQISSRAHEGYRLMGLHFENQTNDYEGLKFGRYFESVNI